MKITIIGTGAYSLGIAKMLAKKKDNNIILWSENLANVEEFQKTRTLNKIFPNIVFEDNISITNSYEKALDHTNLIFIITSVKYYIDVCENIKKYYQGTPICIASKGIHDKTLLPLSILTKNILKTKKIAVISGPTFAIDLINNEPTALAIASYDNNTLNFIKEVLANDTLKLRKSRDIIGIQLCGSIKNIIAIAAGILKGLGYNESTQAFLINESLHDMKNTIYALGGKKKTILSFAGVGDLLLTCSSSKSRNYTFGFLIGSTKDKNKIKEYLDNNTVEGYYSLNSIYKLLQKKGIDIPLINLIKQIVSLEKDPESLIQFLISKP